MTDYHLFFVGAGSERPFFSGIIRGVFLLIVYLFIGGVAGAVTLHTSGTGKPTTCSADSLKLDSYYISESLGMYFFSGECTRAAHEEEAGPIPGVWIEHYKIQGLWFGDKKKGSEIYMFEGECPGCANTQTCIIDFTCPKDPWLEPSVHCSHHGVTELGTDPWCSRLVAERGAPITRAIVSENPSLDVPEEHLRTALPKIIAPQAGEDFFLAYDQEEKEITFRMKAPNANLFYTPSDLDVKVVFEMENEDSNGVQVTDTVELSSDGYAETMATIPFKHADQLHTRNKWTVRTRLIIKKKSTWWGSSPTTYGPWSFWYAFYLNRPLVKIVEPTENAIYIKGNKKNLPLDIRTKDLKLVKLYWYFYGNKDVLGSPISRNILAEYDTTTGPIEIPLDKFENGFWSLTAKVIDLDKSDLSEDSVHFRVKQLKGPSDAGHLQFEKIPDMQFEKKIPEVISSKPDITIGKTRPFYTEGEQVPLCIAHPPRTKVRIAFQRYNHGSWQPSREPVARVGRSLDCNADDGQLWNITFKTPGKWRVRYRQEKPGAKWSKWTSFTIRPRKMSAVTAEKRKAARTSGNIPTVQRKQTSITHKKEPLKSVSKQKKQTVTNKRNVVARPPVIEMPRQGQAFSVASRPVKVTVQIKHAEGQQVALEFQCNQKAVAVDSRQQSGKGETTVWFETSMAGEWRLRARLKAKGARWSQWRNFTVKRISAAKKGRKYGRIKNDMTIKSKN